MPVRRRRHAAATTPARSRSRHPASTGAPARPDACSRSARSAALLAVPLDYSQPHGTKIQLALSMVQHTVPDSKYQGIMLVNPGGPGGSGLIYSIFQSVRPNGAGDAYDWIGFDPRGVGSSVPSLSCIPDYNQGPRPNYIAGQQRGREGLARPLGGLRAGVRPERRRPARPRHHGRLGQGHGQHPRGHGPEAAQLPRLLLRHLPRPGLRDDVPEPAAPRGVRLDRRPDPACSTSPTSTRTWPSRRTSRSGSAGSRSTTASTTSATTEAKPSRSSGTRRRTTSTSTRPAASSAAPSGTTSSCMPATTRSTWLDLGDAFSAYVNNHDVARIVGEYEDTESIGDDNGFAMYLATQCTDAPWPQSFAKIKADNNRVAKNAPFETWANAWFNGPCLGWHGRGPPPAVKVDGSKVKSLLMVDETLDAATPYAGSLEVRKLFPDASLIALPGGTSHANSLQRRRVPGRPDRGVPGEGQAAAAQARQPADTTCAPLPQPDPTAAPAQARSARRGNAGCRRSTCGVDPAGRGPGRSRTHRYGRWSVVWQHSPDDGPPGDRQHRRSSQQPLRSASPSAAAVRVTTSPWCWARAGGRPRTCSAGPRPRSPRPTCPASRRRPSRGTTASSGRSRSATAAGARWCCPRTHLYEGKGVARGRPRRPDGGRRRAARSSSSPTAAAGSTATGPPAPRC